jgi:hypothetical protein
MEMRDRERNKEGGKERETRRDREGETERQRGRDREGERVRHDESTKEMRGRRRTVDYSAAQRTVYIYSTFSGRT